MPISWRLTLWFSAILLVILALSGVAIHTLLQRHLYGEVDQHLTTHTSEVMNFCEMEDITGPPDYEAICSCAPSINDFGSPGIYVRLLDRDGNVLEESDNLGDLELPSNPSLLDHAYSGGVDLATVSATDGTTVRVMASPLPLQSGTVVLEVGQSLEPIESAMSQVRWALVISMLAALVLAILSGGILVRRALAPVVRITRTAQHIEASSDLSQRVGYEGPMDEVGQLATTFDRMIEHIDSVMESQRHFIADASHDLRTPLTVLRGNLALLKRDLGEEDRRESLRAMESEIQKMGKTVDDLLLLAEVESGEMQRREAVQLKEVLLEGLEQGRNQSGSRKIGIGHQDDIAITGDAYKLKRMLGNLVDNAIKYTADDGTITLSLYRDNGWARLEVADDGIGIPSEHLPHVFERFYLVDKGRPRSGGGSGLGLAIVKAIAEQHDGKVTVRSEPANGSVFTAWLPI
jgi:signal transduction histidine kinase